MNFAQVAKSFRKLNPHLFAGKVSGVGCQVSGGKPSRSTLNPQPSTAFQLTILGQVSGGKNNLIITRKGKRIPKRKKNGGESAWTLWKRSAIDQIERQLPADWQAIDQPQNIRLDYFKGDDRVRDQPMVLDALWHVLEDAGVVTNDTYLWCSESSRTLDRENPRVIVTFL